MGIVTARRGQVAGVDVEIAVALLTSVLGVDDVQRMGPPRAGIAEIVEFSPAAPVPIASAVALGTFAASVIARPDFDGGFGKV
jgi:hypothetical protein